MERIIVETLQFDIQRLANPNIRGTDYQQGPLYQTTLRAYVYHRDGGKCQCCGKRPGQDNPLTLDHIVPRAAVGTDRPDNIVAACRKCNMAKGDQPVEQFLSRRPAALARIQAQLRKPLASATHLNIIPALLRLLREDQHQVHRSGMRRPPPPIAGCTSLTRATPTMPHCWGIAPQSPTCRRRWSFKPSDTDAGKG